MENPERWFRTICRRNGVLVGDPSLALLGQYVRLLLEWNQKLNLISRKDEHDVWRTHILHSAALLFKLTIPSGSHLLDLGTGGGLPGIPLKILRPDLMLTLIDSTQKKIRAVANILESLRLEKISAQWGRAEELGAVLDYHEKFHFVVSRGVAPLPDLVRWSLPFLGRKKSLRTSYGNASPPALIALKGGNLESEIKQAQKNKEVKRVDVIAIAFEGSEEIPTPDKKIVLVSF